MPLGEEVNTREPIGDDDPTVSIIITTYNNFSHRGQSLLVLIDSLRSQELSTDCEVVIVDDGSDDGTREYLASLADKQLTPHLSVSVVETPHTGNRAASRNAGIEYAAGQLLLFLDADTVPIATNCLQRTIDQWQQDYILCGARRYWSPPEWTPDGVRGVIERADPTDIRSWAHLPVNSIKRATGRRSLQEFSFLTNFGLVSKQLVKSVGGFDERFEGWGFEDLDLMVQLLRSGTGLLNLWDVAEVLHLNHPLGAATGESEQNRELYYSKLAEYGVAVNVTQLFETPEGTHTDIIISTDGESDRKPSTDCIPIPVSRPSVLEDFQGENERLPTHQFRSNAPVGQEGLAASVVITTYNPFSGKDGSIELVLKALENQHSNDFEVVVVDDGSDDGTWSYLEEYAENTDLSMKLMRFEENTGNRSLARNRGVEVVDNDLLVFLDDDTIPLSSRFIDIVFDCYQPDQFMCGARRFWTKVDWDREWMASAVDQEQYDQIAERCVLPRGINRRAGYRALFDYTFVANLGAVPFNDFEAVDGFDDERMTDWGREDVDLMYRLYLDDTGFLNLYDELAVAHLNHGIKPSESDARETSFDRYEQRERDRGYRFKVNHLYDVYENDGTDVLVPIEKE